MSGAAKARSRCARSSPVAARVEGGHRPEVLGTEGPDRGDRPPRRRGRRSARIRYQVWTSNPSRSYSGRPASVATSTSVRQPAASASSIVARVRARPMPRRRQPGRPRSCRSSRRVPLTLSDARPDDRRRPASATNGRVSGVGRHELEVRAGGRPSRRGGRRRRPASTSAGVIGRMRGVGMAQSYRRRRLTIPRPAAASPVSSAHGHPVALRRRARRPPRPPRADRCRADAARGPAQPHPRPVRDPGRAADRRHRRRRPRRSSSRTSCATTSSRPSLPVEAVLANAPARDGDFIVVPAILDETVDRSDPTPRPRDGRAPAGRRRLVARADRGAPRPPPSATTAGSTPG